MKKNYAYCINSACKMAGTCSHAIIYNDRVTSDNSTINVVNPKSMVFDADGKCQFYCEPKTITVAHGMLKSTGMMPHDIYKVFSLRMQGVFNHTDYFDMRAGRKPMMPRHQKKVISVAKSLGYTFTDSPWDSVTEETQYFD